MSKKIGYTKELLILPFDHRTSFLKKMFNIEQPTESEKKLVGSYKMMIYEGFKKAVTSGLPKGKMGILTDEELGSEVILRAKGEGFTVCVAVEKSGQDEFDFEYGNDYKAHIEKFSPTFAKVLVRYNSEEDKEINQRQARKLAELSQYLLRTGRGYIFELLVPATKEQLKKCNNDKLTFDLEMRPQLMVQAIYDLQDAGVEPDVWKLEGLEREKDCELVCMACQREGRKDVGIIILGRGENDTKVKHWLSVGAKVPGVIGFAVGRTVFWEPLKQFKENKISKEKAIDQIADSYASFCNLWLDLRK